MLGNLFLSNVANNLLKRLKAAHSIVIALFINIVGLKDFGDERTNDPFTFILISDLFGLFNSHISN